MDHRTPIFNSRAGLDGDVRVVGVDGLLTPKGLVTVILRAGELHMIHLIKDVDILLAEQRDAEVIAVNLPLGHEDPDGSRNQGRRECDHAAREYLGGHADLVEPVPPLALFEVESLEEARRIAASKGWPAPGELHWNARQRILALNEAAGDDPRFVEIHPEVSLATILRQLQGPDARLKRRPKSWPGQYERLSLLHVAGLRPMRSFGGVGRASPEDVLAATAAAWSAHRVATGKSRSLPASKGKNRPSILY